MKPFDRWQAWVKAGKKGNKPTITRPEIEELNLRGYGAYIYPRKREVCVNGFMYFRLV